MTEDKRLAGHLGHRVRLLLAEREAELQAQRAQAPVLFRLLSQRNCLQRRMVVENNPRFWTWGLCELLLRKSWERRLDDAKATIELAALGILVAERLDTERWGVRPVHDLRARAWAYLGNGYKITSDFGRATDALENAKAALRKGTGDPLEKASFLRIKAALLSAQDRSQEAVLLLHRAIRRYRLAGDAHAVGTCLAQQALALGRAGDVATAIGKIKDALELLRPEDGPRWYLSARHNLTVLLEMDGQLDQALASLRSTAPLFSSLGDRLSLLHLRLLEGKLCRDLGRPSEAEFAFLEARRGFLARELSLEAAEASLELASLYLGQARFEDIRRLAREIFPVFLDCEMHRHAATALTLFQEAADRNAVTAELITRLLGLVQQRRPNG